MQTVPLGHSVELPMGHKTCHVCAASGAGTPCGLCHWGLRWSSSLRGNETCEGCARIVGADDCGHRQWGLRWSATKRVRGVPELMTIWL
eukprot:6977546-Pyramimonas_sp.AAC.1